MSRNVYALATSGGLRDCCLKTTVDHKEAIAVFATERFPHQPYEIAVDDVAESKVNFFDDEGEQVIASCDVIRVSQPVSTVSVKEA